MGFSLQIIDLEFLSSTAEHNDLDAALLGPLLEAYLSTVAPFFDDLHGALLKISHTL